ncbi:helix-turn-helix domain-containing protein [Konateibacter massiliensis]|uniref:helix-turn-helix domain-containing protein n=1 Tax=Konateibacter massiliensis TaxID=2002841 RepID=UPI000C1468CE|nr:helix-turn-helix transcriptional regulator [Konateibacter massiliensis]
MTFGEKLQYLRKEKKMSQEELASKITVSRQAISKWELNESLPDTDNVIQLSKILGVSIDFLLDDNIDNLKEVPLVKETTKKVKYKNNIVWIIILFASIIISLLISGFTNSQMTVLLIINFFGIILAITLIVHLIIYFFNKR